MNEIFPKIENSLLMVVDVQERLIPAIHEHERIVKNIQILIGGAKVLQMDTIITEQYPKGLGNTVPELIQNHQIPTFSKNSFSCLLEPEVAQYLQSKNKKHLIICGVESHICVLKTALEAQAQGYIVHVVADAISSRTIESKQLALDRLRQSGVFVVSTEMILFMLLDCSGTSEFKAISQLIK